MSSKSTAISLVFVVSVAIFGAAIFKRYDVDRAEAKLVDLRRGVENLERNAKDPTYDRGAVRSTSESERSDPAPATAIADKTRERNAGDTVEQRARKLEFHRLGSHFQYARFEQQLNMTPTQVERFEAMIGRRQAAVDGILSKAADENLGPADPTTLALLQQARAVSDNEIRTELGDAGWQQFSDYSRSQGARLHVDQLTQVATGLNAPLNGTQFGQLVSILNAASPSYLRGGSYSDAGVDWPSVLAQATPYLTQPQVEAMHSLVSRFMAADLIRRGNAQMPAKSGGH